MTFVKDNSENTLRPLKKVIKYDMTREKGKCILIVMKYTNNMKLLKNTHRV